MWRVLYLIGSSGSVIMGCPGAKSACICSKVRQGAEVALWVAVSLCLRCLPGDPGLSVCVNCRACYQ